MLSFISQPYELDYIFVINACCDVFSALYAKFVDPSLSRAAVLQALLRVDAVLQVCTLLRPGRCTSICP